MHRKGSGTKSYNLFLECPPCLVLSKMADKISMSQRVTSQRYIPNNVTLKKTDHLHFKTGASLQRRLGPGNQRNNPQYDGIAMLAKKG